MDITEVKPCPFCGGAYKHDKECYIVALKRYILNAPEQIEDSLDEKWNVRYEPTCKNVAENSTDFECSRCGTQYWDVYEVRYCPACGKKVEKYRED